MRNAQRRGEGAHHVESDPCRRDDIRIETGEPGISLIVCCAGLASEVVAAQHPGAVVRDIVARDDPQSNRVFDVPSDVADRIGHAHDTPFQAHRLQVEAWIGRFQLDLQIEFGESVQRCRTHSGRVNLAVMAEDAVKRLHTEIPAPAFAFELFQRPERLDVVLERRQSVLPA